MKLAIVTSHPIQYNAPIFRFLSERNKIQIKVYYTWGAQVKDKKYDPGFDRDVQWDIPLLDGYEFEWVRNVSKDKGTHHFMGIITPGLNQLIEKWGADAVLIFGWNYHGHLSCMRYFKGKIPIYFRGDSTLLNRNINSIKEKAKAFVLRWVYRYVDLVFYVGTENKKYFQHFGLKDSQLVFAPHAVENERFSETINPSFRNDYEIPENSILYLFAGKFESIKNLFHLVDSFVQSKNNSAYLLLAGAGKLAMDLKRNVANYPVHFQNRIKFCGFVNQKEMPSLYASCDVFVLPSISETWGLSVNEAMASGKAVIVSDRCGCARDLVDHGINGYIFRLKESNDLTNKIDLIKDRHFAHDLGRKSLEKIKNYNMLIFVQALEKAFMNVR